MKLILALFSMWLLFNTSAFAAGCGSALAGLYANPNRPALEQYATVEKLYRDGEDFSRFQPRQGIFVASRDAGQNVTRAVLRVLTDNPASRIEVIGEFNDWGRSAPPVRLFPDPADPAYHVGEIPGLRHGMQYRLLENGAQRIDPAAVLFNTPEYSERFRPNEVPYLNSIFWDPFHPGAYRLQTKGVDLRGKPVLVTEQGLHELVARWPHQGRTGPSRVSETYKFVAESGVISEVARGNNVIEFLPVTSFVDGSSWHLHYQVFGNFGPDSRYGTPDEFKQMVDGFHRAGVAVVMDIVPGHYPYNGNGGWFRNLHDVGLHQWQSRWGRSLYGWNPSPWATNRYDYQNPYVRRFLIDGVLTMMRDYGIDGIRIDNVDGIRGEPAGYQFLHELAVEIRRYRPDAYINGEGFSDHAPAVRRTDWGMGLGMDTTNDPDFFYGFIQPNAQAFTENIDMNRLRDNLRNQDGWQQAPRLRLITSHDEAANAQPGFSGAYPATLLKGGGDYYVIQKTKALDSLAMLAGSFSMDMLQAQLGQEGTFYNNPDVDWSLLQREPNRKMRDYFVALYQAIKDRPAFAFQNHDANLENHVDYQNKVITLQRIDFKTGRFYYVVLNLGHHRIDGYRFGIAGDGDFRVLLDSDRQEHGGSGEFRAKLPGDLLRAKGPGDHGKPRSLELPVLAPYQVLILEQQ